MYSMTLLDGSETLHVPERPTGDALFTDPLPCGLTLGDAVVVRACEVAVGDLVIALTVGEAGAREVQHCPAIFLAVPGQVGRCGCSGCPACDDLEESAAGDDRVVGEFGWRYVCLCPSDWDEECVIESARRPVIVVRADRVQGAEAEQGRGPREFVVSWSVEVEAAGAVEAARLADGRLREQVGQAPVLGWVVSELGGEPSTVSVLAPVRGV
ncbi:hypothetical protein ACIQCR_16830 [Streptomyces sp. NPDC093249]|uniref:hypothetical protein n=1 Tax=unclassified Streptomyces TaxID=2593676 RepID=UPI0034510CEE